MFKSNSNSADVVQKTTECENPVAAEAPEPGGCSAPAKTVHEEQEYEAQYFGFTPQSFTDESRYKLYR